MKCAALTAAALLTVASSAATGQTPRALRLQEELRIGSIDRENYDFSFISGIAVADDGRMFVGQPLEHTVRVYSPAGSFLRRIGREGGGPGEMRGVDGVGWVGNALYVLDWRLGRLTQFNTMGRAVRIWSAVQHDWGDAFSPMPPSMRMMNGSLITTPNYYTPPGKSLTSLPLSLVDPEGKYVKDIAQLSVGTQVKVVKSSSGWTSPIPLPDATSTLSAVLPVQSSVILVDRKAPGTSGRTSYTIRRIAADGSTAYSRTYTLPPVNISRSAVEREIDSAVARSVRARPVPENDVRDLYNLAWSDVTHQSPVDQIAVGADGSVWLRAGAFGEPKATWYAHAPDGTLLGYTTLPGSAKVHHVTATRVWVSERGEYDEEYVVRYRIR
jgi:hypothetical protein